MRISRLALFAVLAFALWSASCKKHRPDRSDGGGRAGRGTAAGSGGGAVAGTAGSAGALLGGASGAAGSGGGTDAVCGDGLRQGLEPCDGADVGGLTCQDRGFDDGEVACIDCTLDLTGCSGTERCTDGRDNDGDEAVDCADSECVAACQDACVAPVELEPPAGVGGLTLGHAARYDPSCTSPGLVSGPEIIYVFAADTSGVAEAKLTTEAALVLAITSDCGGGELACSPLRRVEAPVEAGATYYLQVDGFEPGASGAYSLELDVRAVRCGDGHRDLEEVCDDGNTDSGDGCSADCEIELNEIEPNDTPGEAIELPSPVLGVIEEGDQDVIRVEVTETPASISVVVGDFAEGACAAGELDAEVEIVGTDGVSVLSTSGEHGASLCPRASAGGLAAGTYYVAIRADGAGMSPTFAYAAEIQIDTCGDRTLSLFEECDDGGRSNGDGCAADCTVEPDETEPNDVVAEAELLPSPIRARIGTEGDVDVYRVKLSGDGSIAATTAPLRGGECTSGPETQLDLIDADGSTVIVSGASLAGDHCSSVEFWTLPAGTYYLRVSAPALAQAHTFGYVLDFEADECGNGRVLAAEDCDDGNNEDGDGCSWDCLDE